MSSQLHCLFRSLPLAKPGTDEDLFAELNFIPPCLLLFLTCSSPEFHLGEGEIGNLPVFDPSLLVL